MYLRERTSTNKLLESMTFLVVAGSVNHEQVFDDLQSQWGNAENSPLAVLLVTLIALGRLHQTGHWQAYGDPFYGDHQLFDRLYNDVIPEIDSLGEKTIGLGGTELVNPVVQAHQVDKLVAMFSASTPVSVPRPIDLVSRSYASEMHFLRFLEIVYERLGNNLSLGTDNLLSTIADKHEEHVYLLRQRLTRETNQ